MILPGGFLRTVLLAAVAECLTFFALAAAEGLEVSGKEILLDGQPVRLRGVAVGDPFLARKDRPDSDYREIAEDWRANVVRVSVHPTVWKHASSHAAEGKAGLIKALRREVDAARDAGLAVILDWHVIGWPDGYYEPVKPEWGAAGDLYDSDFELARDFWGRMAREFAGDGRVAFEIWNEPVSEKGWENNSRWAELKPFWESLTDTIRAHAGNLIIAPGGVWSYNLRGIREDPLPDANTAYAWHIYAGHSEGNESGWAAALDDLPTLKPVLVTEWGFVRETSEHFRGTPQTFGIKFRDRWLEGRGLHSTAWCWHPVWTPRMLEADWRTPTEFGAFVKEYLKTAARESRVAD